MREGFAIPQGKHLLSYSPQRGGFTIKGEEFKGVISQDYALWREGNQLVLENLGRGNLRNITAPQGSPLLLKGGIYSVDYGSGYMEQFSPRGESLWQLEEVAPITAVDAQGGVTAVATLDGYVRFYNTLTGESHSFLPPPGKFNEVIYALALSQQADRLALLSGQEQTLRIISLEDPNRIYFESFLGTKYRRPVKMFYLAEKNLLWVEGASGEIGQWDLQKGSQKILPYKGLFLTLVWDEADKISYILSTQGDRSFIQPYSFWGSPLPDFSFEARPRYFALQEGMLLISTEEKFLLLTRGET